MFKNAKNLVIKQKEKSPQRQWKLTFSAYPDVDLDDDCCGSGGFAGLPGCRYILKASASVGVMQLVIPVLAFAGLSLVKDLPVLKSLGWRIIVVSLAANAGTFIFGTVMAEIFH